MIFDAISLGILLDYLAGMELGGRAMLCGSSSPSWRVGFRDGAQGFLFDIFAAIIWCSTGFYLLCMLINIY